MPELCFFNNYIAIQLIWIVNKQFGFKNNNNFLPVACWWHYQFTRVALMFELLQYYSSQEKYWGLWKCYKLKIESYMHFQMLYLLG